MRWKAMRIKRKEKVNSKTNEGRNTIIEWNWKEKKKDGKTLKSKNSKNSKNRRKEKLKLINLEKEWMNEWRKKINRSK